MNVAPESTGATTEHQEKLKEEGLPLFRLRTNLQVHRSAVVFGRASGLRPNQFVVSRWGFPTMPVPEPRRASGRVRLAPINAKATFLGHPLFWIEPTLTDRAAAETGQDWCIRMYYLLSRLGLWRDSSWVDFPRSRGVRLSPVDIEGYRMRQNPAIATDGRPDCVFLTDASLHGGIQAHISDVEGALEEVRTLKESIQAEIAHQTALAFRTVEELIGPDEVVIDPLLVSPESVGNYWQQTVQPKLDELVQRYETAIMLDEAGHSNLSLLTELAYETAEQIQGCLGRLRASTGQLALPVLQHMADTDTSASVTDSYLDELARRRRSTHEVARILSSALEERGGTSMVNAEADVIGLYVRARQSLQLAYVNYRLHEVGKAPFLDSMALDFDLTSRKAGKKSVTASAWPLHPEDSLETLGDPAINPRRIERPVMYWPEIIEGQDGRYEQ